MKQIEKKKPSRSVPARAKAAAAAVFLLAAGLFCFVLFAPHRDNEPAVPEKTEKETVLHQCTLEEIASVTITPQSGASYTLAVADGALVLAQDPDYPIRTGILDLIRENVCTVRSERLITAFTETDAAFLSLFGLDPPCCSVQINMTDGKVHRIRIGSQIQGDDIPYYYFLWDEDRMIYAGGTDMYSAFSYEWGQLHTVESLGIRTDLLDRFAVTGDNDLSLAYTDTGWYCTSPFRYPLDQERVTGYLQNVKNLQFSAYVGRADSAAREEYGLSRPALTLSFTEAASTLTVPDDTGETHTYPIPERSGTVLFGIPCDEWSRYAEYNGSIYTVSRFLSDFLFSAGASDLVPASPFCVEIYQLSSLTVQFHGKEETYSLTLNEELQGSGDLVTDENGHILYSLTVEKNGSPFDADAFLHWYNHILRALVPMGKMTEPLSPAGEAEAVFTLYGSKDIRSISFVPVDALHYAMAVDGTALYYVSMDQFSALTDAP